MDWTLHAMGNALAAVWPALALAGAMLGRPRRREKTARNGAGLVLWGSYLVALLALNLHTSPFGTLPSVLRYTGLALAGASMLARLLLLAIPGDAAYGGRRRAGPIYSAVFCIGLTAASGDLIALVTVLVASSAAAAVALSDLPAGDWDTGSR
jgi:hypothetical protein